LWGVYPGENIEGSRFPRDHPFLMRETASAELRDHSSPHA